MGSWTCLTILGVLTVTAASPAERAVDVSHASIEQYPFAVVVLELHKNNWRPFCGGAIINKRSFLSLVSCFGDDSQKCARTGSSVSSSGGSVHNIAAIINHPDYNFPMSMENGIAVIRVDSEFSPNSRPIKIAGPNYNFGDNQCLSVVGWGFNFPPDPSPEQLHHVQMRGVNHASCSRNHGTAMIKANTVCAAWPGDIDLDFCTVNYGTPLLHNNVIVGLFVLSKGCTNPASPDIYVQVSRYSSWIESNA